MDEPTIAGEQKSNRHLMDISEEDQIFVNAEYNSFYQKIYNKCMGADHMNIGRRTEMKVAETISDEEAVAAFKKQRAKDDGPMNCFKKVTGIRYIVMAEMMEEKMQKLQLSDKERAEWQEDIAAVREAGETGAAMPKTTDPNNQYRAMMRLTDANEQMALGEKYSARSQEEMAKCSAQSSHKIQEREIKSGGLVDHSKSPANKKAQKQTKSTKFNNVKGGSLGAGNLTYMKGYVGCFAPLKGHFAKVHADKLEAKLKTAGNISDQKRKEWEEDIAAWREAEQNGADTPNPPDPDNPYRWYDYVTNADRQAINKEHADFNNKIMKECGDKPAGL